MIHTSTLATINRAMERLLTELLHKREDYQRLGEPTSSRAQAKLSRLAREIESLEKRLARAERLQERALTGRFE